jgi:16S rRNA (guanine1207-N2)-methyltransferase
MAHYFDARPSAPSATAVVHVAVGGAAFTMRTDRGVFSHGRLDAGTELLLREAPHPPAQGTLLDLGCGAGPLALALAQRAPGATVWAVDANERAVTLTAANAAANGMRNVVAAEPGAAPADLRFDLIWSNPPIRIGKPALHDLLATWLARLTPAGRAVLVVQRHLGADSLQRWLTEHGWPTRRLASSKGYRLLDVAAAQVVS